MKVLYFIHTYGERNGISNHVLQLSEALPAGFEPQVICGKGAPLPLFSSLRLPLVEFFQALSSDFDLVSVHGYGNLHSFAGAVISILKGKPLVFTVHGYPRIEGARRIFYYLYRQLLARVILFRASAIISVSSEAAAMLGKETSKPIAILPNGVDLARFFPKTPYKKAGAVCYIGRLDADKGVERLFECKAFPLLIVGPNEGGERGRLEKLAKGRGIHADFAEAGFEQMGKVYEKCRYVVLPSKYEGFPLTLLESAAMGRPFISTAVGEVREVLGRLFDSPEKFVLEGDLGEKIFELEKQDLGPQLSLARKRLVEYSWESVAKRTAAVYLKAAAKK